jgi:D-beta-D-heptose 7-phosphate kinase/D-beta-D-heptose 1-phosphate adenosyltransferase
LIVGVDSDEMVRRVKGRGRPIIPQSERLEMVRSLSPVDVAFILDGLGELEKIVSMFNVSSVFKHEGFRNIDDVVGVTGTGAELVIVPDVPGLVSTTEIIERAVASRRTALHSSSSPTSIY